MSSNNKTLLNLYQDALIGAVMERIELLRHFDCNETLSPKDLVERGLMDPCKLFIKNEPHKLEKIRNKRLRLIFSVSLCDNLIAYLLGSQQNQNEIVRWELIPPSAGMGLTDEDHSLVRDYVRGMEADGSTIIDSDVSGWDFSVQESEFRHEFERRLALNGGTGTDWERVARAHMFCMARKVFVLSNGEMYQQTIPGVLPSGWYLTASMNSNVRALNHYDIALRQSKKPKCKTMGDDCLERSVDNPIEEYAIRGHKVKHVNKCSSQEFEFCSTHFTADNAVPVNIDKMLVNMLTFKASKYDELVERFFQFRNVDLRNHPDRDELCELVRRSGWWERF